MDINLPLEPPVNNSLQPTIYDKLGQIAFEKTRVANSQLDSRLSLQEKVLGKYRQDVERVHAYQKQRLRREVRKIRQKKPDYVFDDSDISTRSRSKASSDFGRPRSLSEPVSNTCYCRRYYSHHFNIKDTSKKDEDVHEKKDHSRDFCNLALRLYFVNIMNSDHKQHSPEQVTETRETERLPNHSPNHLPALQSLRYGAGHRIMSQSSIEDSDNDDVFNLSYGSFRTNIDSLKQKGSVDCLTEVTEASELTTGTREDRSEKVGKRKRQQHGSVRRLSSKASEADLENYGTGLRKSKHAFEKIFSGLL